MTRVTSFALASLVATTLAAPSQLPLCAQPCPKSASHCKGQADMNCLCRLDPYIQDLEGCYVSQKCNPDHKALAMSFSQKLCSEATAIKGHIKVSEPSTPVTKKGGTPAPGGGQGHKGEATFNTFDLKKPEEQHKVNKPAQDPEQRPSDGKHGADEHPSLGNSQDGPARSSSQTGKLVGQAGQKPLVDAPTHPHHPSSVGHEGQQSKVGDLHLHPLSAPEQIQKLTPPKTPTPLRETDKQNQTSRHTSLTHQSPPIENPENPLNKKPPTEVKPTTKSEQGHKPDMPPSETQKPKSRPPTAKMEKSPGKEKAPAQTSKKAPAGDGPAIGSSSTNSSDPIKKPVQDLTGNPAPQNQSAGSKPPPASNPAAGTNDSLQTQTSNITDGGPGTTGGQSSPPPLSRGAPAYIVGSWTCLITLGTVIGAAWTMI